MTREKETDPPEKAAQTRILIQRIEALRAELAARDTEIVTLSAALLEARDALAQAEEAAAEPGHEADHGPGREPGGWLRRWLGGGAGR